MGKISNFLLHFTSYYLLKMSGGKSRIWHFRDPKFKNFLGDNAPRPPPPSSKRLQRFKNVFSCVHLQNPTLRPWAVECSATALLADPGVFALYLVHFIKEGSSVSLLNTAIHGASWVHKKSGYQELNEHPLVRQVAQAGRRILAKPPNRKKALDVSLVKKIISRLEHGNLVDIQVASLFALGFFGFLRWDDLSRLTVDNLQFADTHLANDQFRDGSWVLVARCSSSPCPVAVVEKFLKVGRHEKKSRLFRWILHTEKRMELRSVSCRRKSWILSCMESTVLGPEEHHQQQPLMYLIGYSKGRGDGVVRGQKTITFRSPWSHC